MFALITIPLYINLAMVFFSQTNMNVTLSFADTFERLMLMVLLPTMAGMVIRHRFPVFAEKSNRNVKKVAVVCLVLLIAWIVVQQRHSLINMLFATGPAVTMLCVLIMCCSYGFSSLFKLPDAQRTAITLESGMQRGGMAIVIAAGILESAAMAVPAAIYSLVMYLFAGTFVLIKNNRAVLRNDYNL